MFQLSQLSEQQQISDTQSMISQLQKPNALKYQFYLPTGNFNSFDVENIKEIQQKLLGKQNFNYFRRKKRGKYLYYLCKFCQARVVVIQQQNRLRLSKFENYHVHQRKKNRKIQEEMVLKLIQQSFKIQSPEQLRKRILDHMPISINRYNYILRKFVDNNCYQRVLEYLNQKQYLIKVSHKQEEQLPQLMLFMSPQQRKTALKYNDCFSFDITYNVLKNRSKQMKQWGLGVFTTFDTNLRIMPVAFALILHQDSKTFSTLFRGFLQFIQTRTCSIITDGQRSIRAGLNDLVQNQIYKGNHVLDSFHLLRNIKKNVTQEEFPLYHTLITTKYPYRFQKALKILENAQNNIYMINQIKENAEKYCFSKSKPKFIGLSFTSSGTQKCNDFIKTIIPRQTNIFRLILALKKIENKQSLFSNKFETKKYQKLFGDERILEVRTSVEQKIFLVFLKNYVKALKYQVNPVQNTQMMYKSNGIKTTGRNCECFFNKRAGIPCAHMLSVLIRYTDIPYINFFNWRWTDLIKNEKIKTKTGSRRSRRRR